MRLALIPVLHHRLRTCLLSLGLLVLLPFQAQAQSGAQSGVQGDAVAGAKIFLKCRSCHVLDQPTHKMGPHLVQIFGRKAGSAEGFRYSDAMNQAGENGLIWDENSLKEFLTSPKAMIPGTSMRFWGLWEGQIDDLMAYLKENTQAAPDE